MEYHLTLTTSLEGLGLRRPAIYFIYCSLSNWEAGEVAGVRLWTESATEALRAYGEANADLAARLDSEVATIAASDDLAFTSGYSLHSAVLAFSKNDGESLKEAESRVLQEIGDADDPEALVKAATIEFEAEGVRPQFDRARKEGMRQEDKMDAVVEEIVAWFS